MKNLVLGSLIAMLASQAAGCIFVADDTTDYAHVAATWSLRNESTGAATSCPTGFDTAALFNQAVDGGGNPIGTCSSSANNNESTCFVDLFDCEAHAGTSFPLPPTRYKTWIEITDHAVANIYASTIPAYVDISDVDLTYNAQILNDGGYFYFRWNLQGQSSGAPLTCGSAPGGVELIGTDVTNSSNSHSDMFDCIDGGDYTAGYQAATYTVSIDALNAADQAIGTAAPLTNKTIGRQNAVTDLGTVTIPITGL